MKIQWIGHSSFIIETGAIRLVTDPYEDYTGYPILHPKADIVTISHEHRDHNAVHHIPGQPRIIRGSGQFEVNGISIEGFSSYHDDKKGAARGAVTIYRISTEGLNVVHLSDLGIVPDPHLVAAIGAVDLLLIPIGGVYTINAAQAFETVQLFQPRYAIPMHYRTEHCTFEIGLLEEFTMRFDKYLKLPILEISASEPAEAGPQVVVLEYLAR